MLKRMKQWTAYNETPTGDVGKRTAIVDGDVEEVDDELEVDVDVDSDVMKRKRKSTKAK